MDTKSITSDTELACALDNVLWVENLVQYMIKKGCAMPIVDLLKAIEKVHPQKYNEIQAKLEHVLSQELDKWDSDKTKEIKQKIKKTFVPIDCVFQTTTDKHGNRIKNISWTSNMTFGCSYGHFVLIIGRYEFLPREGFVHFFVDSLEELNKVTHGVQGYYFTLYNGCNFIPDDLDDNNCTTKRELKHLGVIMKQKKCSCATGHPEVGKCAIDDCAWLDVLDRIGERRVK